MTAEPIAKVISDLRRHRAGNPCPATASTPQQAAGAKVTERALELVEDPVVVDATAIYESLKTSARPVAVYEDHPCIAQPWREAAVCFVNEYGTVFVLHLVSTQRDELLGNSWDDIGKPIPHNQPVHVVREDDVFWRVLAFMWVGGRGQGGLATTVGPLHSWQIDIYEDGSPADIRSIDIIHDHDYAWDEALLVLLGTFNFLACRNVELVEPQRPRPERRRLAAMGVTVKTLNVFPVGRSTRGGVGGQGGGVPLTSVRGSFHHYGPKYGRGLLFGRHEGKFWVPQHARGDAQIGRVEHDYRLHTAPTR
jgi:hypothetical protein